MYIGGNIPYNKKRDMYNFYLLNIVSKFYLFEKRLSILEELLSVFLLVSSSVP